MQEQTGNATDSTGFLTASTMSQSLSGLSQTTTVSAVSSDVTGESAAAQSSLNTTPGVSQTFSIEQSSSIPTSSISQSETTAFSPQSISSGLSSAQSNIESSVPITTISLASESQLLNSATSLIESASSIQLPIATSLTASSIATLSSVSSGELLPSSQITLSATTSSFLETPAQQSFSALSSSIVSSQTTTASETSSRLVSISETESAPAIVQSATVSSTPSSGLSISIPALTLPTISLSSRSSLTSLPVPSGLLPSSLSSLEIINTVETPSASPEVQSGSVGSLARYRKLASLAFLFKIKPTGFESIGIHFVASICQSKKRRSRIFVGDLVYLAQFSQARFRDKLRPEYRIIGHGHKIQTSPVASQSPVTFFLTFDLRVTGGSGGTTTTPIDAATEVGVVPKRKRQNVDAGRVYLLLESDGRVSVTSECSEALIFNIATDLRLRARGLAAYTTQLEIDAGGAFFHLGPEGTDGIYDSFARGTSTLDWYNLLFPSSGNRAIFGYPNSGTGNVWVSFDGTLPSGYTEYQFSVVLSTDAEFVCDVSSAVSLGSPSTLYTPGISQIATPSASPTLSFPATLTGSVESASSPESTLFASSNNILSSEAATLQPSSGLPVTQSPSENPVSPTGSSAAQTSVNTESLVQEPTSAVVVSTAESITPGISAATISPLPVTSSTSDVIIVTDATIVPTFEPSELPVLESTQVIVSITATQALTTGTTAQASSVVVQNTDVSSPAATSSSSESTVASISLELSETLSTLTAVGTGSGSSASFVETSSLAAATDILTASIPTQASLSASTTSEESTLLEPTRSASGPEPTVSVSPISTIVPVETSSTAEEPISTDTETQISTVVSSGSVATATSVVQPTLGEPSALQTSEATIAPSASPVIDESTVQTSKATSPVTDSTSSNEPTAQTSEAIVESATSAAVNEPSVQTSSATPIITAKPTTESVTSEAPTTPINTSRSSIVSSVSSFVDEIETTLTSATQIIEETSTANETPLETLTSKGQVPSASSDLVAPVPTSSSSSGKPSVVVAPSDISQTGSPTKSPAGNPSSPSGNTSLPSESTNIPPVETESIQTDKPVVTTKPSSPLPLTTSTVYTTATSTITSCPPSVPNCQEGQVVTRTESLYTTIYPVTSQPTNPADLTTSTVYTTMSYTVTACPSTVKNCPIGQLTTETINVYTTVCPVSQPATPVPTAPCDDVIGVLVTVIVDITVEVQIRNGQTETIYRTETFTKDFNSLCNKPTAGQPCYPSQITSAGYELPSSDVTVTRTCSTCYPVTVNQPEPTVAPTSAPTYGQQDNNYEADGQNDLPPNGDNIPAQQGTAAPAKPNGAENAPTYPAATPDSNAGSPAKPDGAAATPNQNNAPYNANKSPANSAGQNPASPAKPEEAAATPGQNNAPYNADSPPASSNAGSPAKPDGAAATPGQNNAPYNADKPPANPTNQDTASPAKPDASDHSEAAAATQDQNNVPHPPLPPVPDHGSLFNNATSNYTALNITADQSNVSGSPSNYTAPKLKLKEGSSGASVESSSEVTSSAVEMTTNNVAVALLVSVMVIAFTL
ncbi:hypothetical protein BUE80_DR010753 [Diplocarpon rosae]|nr:hypothetical protein BUE80_DR010753 [Diplocarpon rosae]